MKFLILFLSLNIVFNANSQNDKFLIIYSSCFHYFVFYKTDKVIENELEIINFIDSNIGIMSPNKEILDFARESKLKHKINLVRYSSEKHILRNDSSICTFYYDFIKAEVPNYKVTYKFTQDEKFKLIKYNNIFYSNVIEYNPDIELKKIVFIDKKQNFMFQKFIKSYKNPKKNKANFNI